MAVGQPKIVPGHGVRDCNQMPTVACELLVRSMMLSDTDQAWLFFLIAGALGACFIWAFWEIEEARRRRLRISGSANRPAKGRQPEFY
jgi:hypothetical protein